MISCERHVGRLVEIRIASPVALPELQAFMARLRGLLGEAEGKSVIAADFREAKVFGDDVAAALSGVMKADNPKVERSGILVSNHVVASMQLDRLVREANNPARRTFKDPGELFAYLGEVLTPEETTRSRSFLGAGAG